MNRFTTLKQRSDFLRIRDRGKSAVTKHLLLSYLSEGKGLRVGVSITKKIDKRSARRNRLRRRLKEALRQDIRELQFDGGLAIVLVARNGATELTYKALHDELARVIKKAGFID